MVIAVFKLAEIASKMLAGNMNMRAPDAALQLRPEPVNGVYVGLAARGRDGPATGGPDAPRSGASCPGSR